MNAGTAWAFLSGAQSPANSGSPGFSYALAVVGYAFIPVVVSLIAVALVQRSIRSRVKESGWAEGQADQIVFGNHPAPAPTAVKAAAPTAKSTKKPQGEQEA
jgi:hypothetical protein